jgi:hypothetical protein
MNIDDESVALLSLLNKYKPSPQDFVLARMAARVEILEFMLVELAAPGGGEKKRQIAERNEADYMKLTEGYLAFLTGHIDDVGAPDRASASS